jgi:VanZ family protein
MVAIFVVSSLPDPPSPPGLSDKSGHFLAYVGLGALAVRATSGASVAGVTGGAVGAAWAIATVYGAFDEVHQGFVPERTSDVRDWLADAIGAATAVVAVWLSAILLRSRRTRGASPRS